MSKQATVPVPTDWLARVVGLLDTMAGEGMGMQDCADPADLMCEIAVHMGLGDASDPWAAVAVALTRIAQEARRDG